MKAKCDYCGGITRDDDRGNCAACGAPRAAIEPASARIIVPMTAKPEPDWVVVSDTTILELQGFSTGIAWEYQFSIRTVSDG